MGARGRGGGGGEGGEASRTQGGVNKRRAGREERAERE